MLAGVYLVALVGSTLFMIVLARRHLEIATRG
jgi:hypothetical protein